MSSMKSGRGLTAFFSGVLLYCAAIALARVMASLPLPAPVYALIGKRGSVEFLVTQAIAIAVVLFLLALVWVFLTVRARHRSARSTTVACLTGIAISWVGWLMFGAFFMAFNSRSYSVPWASLVLASHVPPLWGVFNTLGVFLGAGAAGVWASRRRASMPSRRNLQAEPVEPSAPA